MDIRTNFQNKKRQGRRVTNYNMTTITKKSSGGGRGGR